MARKKQAERPAEVLPSATGVSAALLASKIARSAVWADSIVRRAQPLVTVGFGRQLHDRFQVADGTGTLAAEVASRFVRADFGEQKVQMEIAPFSPPQRQVSSARQGALERPAALSANSPNLLDDLKNMGWV